MKPLKWSLAGLAAFLVALSFWPRAGKTTTALLPPALPALKQVQASAPSNGLLSYGAAQRGDVSPTAAPSVPTVAIPARPTGVPSADFANWVDRFLTTAWSADQAALLDEGERLAEARRAALAIEIEENPRAALEKAVPYRWRQSLPERITRHFETPVAGVANFEVFMASPLPGADYVKFKHHVYRYATLSGRTFRAYVYGERSLYMSRPTLMIHGIAIDDALAIHEEPARLLDAEEATAVSAGLAQPVSPACGVCGEATTAAAQLMQVGDNYVKVCGVSEASSLNRALMSSETKPNALYSALPTWTNQPPKSVLPTFGTRRALYMRLVFRDDITIPISEVQAQAEMTEVNDFFIENSYAKTAVIPTITPVITLPKPKARYSKEGPGSLMTDAMAEAAKLGYAAENFELYLARFTPVPGYDWGGLGGGKTAWLQGNGAGLAIHEIGHCYGLGHANFWETRRATPPTDAPDRFDVDSVVGHDSVIGAGDDIEYGDPFDVMGSGGGESRNTNSQTISRLAGHFNPVGKNLMGWLPDSAIKQYTANGTNRIYVHDTAVMAEGRSYAMKIRKDEQRSYWLSARNRNTDNPWLTNGVSLHWGTWSEQIIGYSTLLDATPGTVPGKQDSAIAIGRTFVDPESSIYITPVARGGSAGDTYYDVVVNQGAHLGSDPTARLTASATNVAVNKPVTFTVEAADADGDKLAYYWDVSDGSVGPNQPTLTRTWNQPGDYRVRVEVSDMKGGLVIRHVVVRVGNVPNFRISGVVLDDKGTPVPNVRVGNGALTNNTDLAGDYQATFTDSDGAFTLINQTQGDHAVTAFLHGYITRPANFNAFITIAGDDVDGLEFLAQEQTRVTVRVGSDADLVKGRAGTFNFTRTGDINTQIRAVFIMKGSAVEGTDFAKYTNTTVHTNALRTLLADVNKAVNFYFVDFATGVFETNITIAAVTNATAADEKYLSAAVMYALQKELSYPTNVDDGNGGQTNGFATNYTFMTGWEVLSTTGEDVWYQTYGDYVVGAPAEARMRFKALPSNQPVISIAAISKAASENGGDSALFMLTRSGKTDVPVDVRLGFSGTATYNQDYVAVPDFITIPAYVTTLALPVYIRPDLYLEGNETLAISILTNTGYKVGTAKAEVTIGDNDLPSLTVAATDPVASEAGVDNALVTVTRVGDLTRELVVNYLVGGTAVSGRDYRALPGSLRIPAGQPSAALVIQPRDNRVKDGGQTLEIILSDSPTYNVGSPGVASVFIQDGALPTVNIRATKDAGAEPSDPAEFTITRQGDTKGVLVVNLAVGGTARAVADYSPITSLGRIPSGVASVVIQVTPVNDNIREDAETVICEILPSTNYNIGTQPQAVATITDDDGGGRLGVGFNFAGTVVSEGVRTAVVAVAVSGNPAEDVTVDWRVTGGSAIPGIDYPATNASGRLLFTNVPDPAISNRVQLISLPLIDDAVARPDRTIVLSLVEPASIYSNEVVTNEITLTNAAGEPIGTTNILVTNTTITPVPMNAVFDVHRSHTLTVLDDDASVVTLEVADGTALEQGRKPGLIKVKRVGPTTRDQVVQLTVAGTAGNGSDYETIPGTVIIPMGDDTLDLPVIPVDDPMQEFMENVVVSIVNAPGATIGTNRTATINIVDNDGTVEFSSPAYTFYEGAGRAEITVRRTSDTNLAATVAFEAVAGTATTNDFIATNGLVSFAPGEILKSFQVELLDDHIVETDKTVALSLRNLSDGVPLGGQISATLIIWDDDTEVGVLASRVQAIESDPTVDITAYRYGITTNLLRVEVTATTNGTALDGIDFVATNYALVFQPGRTTAVAQVKLIDDIQFDGDRTVEFVLTNLDATATYAASTNAQVVILDDECTLQLTATDVRVNEYGRQVTLNVERGGSSIQPVQIEYKTTNGTATAGRDYLSASGRLLFAGAEIQRAPDGTGVTIVQPGETNRSITVRITDDLLGEGDETFTLSVFDAYTTGGVGLPGTVVLGANTNALVTIVDNEAPGSVDFEYNPGAGANGPVRSLALQDDGKVLVGGEFTEFDEVALNHIARLHDDAYLDTFLNPGEGFDGNVLALAVQPDGRLVAGGEFTRLNTNTLGRIARMNADGSVDPQFRVGFGADAPVRASVLDLDGSIVIGGDFMAVNGIRATRLARIANNGTVDATFAPAFDGSVLAVAIQPDGKVLAGGSFASGGGRAFLTRLNPDGTTDTGFSPAATPDGAVRAVVVQLDGRIVVAGEFRNVGGVPRNRVARLNADGSLDAEFDPGAGPNAAVYTAGVIGDGKVVIGGEFTQVDGADRNRIARLNPNGSVDRLFDVGTGANAPVLTLLVQPDTAVVIGGEFTEVNGVPRNRIARLHGDEKFVQNVIQFASAFYRVKESGGEATITLERSGDLSAPATVQSFTLDGTATSGSDYDSVRGPVTFGVNETVKTFTVRILNDSLGEGDETVKLGLSSLPPGYSTLARLSATLTIEDDESAVALASANITVKEGDGQASVVVRRTGPTTSAVSVDYTTRDGTAFAGSDYVAATGTITFAAGETEKPIVVGITDDAEAEASETLSIDLSNPQGGAVLGSLRTCLVNILDNDRVDSYALNITPPLGGTVTPPSGSYPVGSKQTVTALAERGFRFVGWSGTVTSTDNPIIVTMDQNHRLTAAFEPVQYTYTFEPPFSPLDLRQPPWATSSTQPWQLQSAVASGGRFAIRSGAIGDGQESTMQLVVNSRGGATAFDVRVSSEANWDFAEFLVDGLRVERWTGEVAWKTYIFNLAPGTHTLAWRYVKDNNYSAGLDGVFVDNIFVPSDVPDPTDPAAVLDILSVPGGIQIWVTGRAGLTYTLQESADLTTWSTVASYPNTTGTIVINLPVSPTAAPKFYRTFTTP